MGRWAAIAQLIAASKIWIGALHVSYSAVDSSEQDMDRCAAPSGREASTIKVNVQTRSLFGRTVGAVGVITSYKGETWDSDGSVS